MLLRGVFYQERQKTAGPLLCVERIDAALRLSDKMNN